MIVVVVVLEVAAVAPRPRGSEGVEGTFIGSRVHRRVIREKQKKKKMKRGTKNTGVCFTSTQKVLCFYLGKLLSTSKLTQEGIQLRRMERKKKRNV